MAIVLLPRVDQGIVVLGEADAGEADGAVGGRDVSSPRSGDRPYRQTSLARVTAPTGGGHAVGGDGHGIDAGERVDAEGSRLRVADRATNTDVGGEIGNVIARILQGYGARGKGP